MDAAQLVPHNPVSVIELDCDFLAFSGHKMLGPTASGGLYAQAELLDAMDPMFGGGEMIHEVFHDRSTWKDIPHKFEAGHDAASPSRSGLGAAIDYLEALGMDAVRAHEEEITALRARPAAVGAGATSTGRRTPTARGGAVSFWYQRHPPARPGDGAGREGVAIRAATTARSS